MSKSPAEVMKIAAALDSTLSPEQAVARAEKLIEQVERSSQADEIKQRDEQEEKALLAETVRLTEIGLGGISGETLSMRQAFAFAGGVANDRQTPAYKTDARFVSALRKFNLTILITYYRGTFDDRLTSSDPEQLVDRVEEVTSQIAVERLFILREQQVKALDRQRKSDLKKAKSLKTSHGTQNTKKRKSSNRKRK